jgi:CHAT domain-containing protein
MTPNNFIWPGFICCLLLAVSLQTGCQSTRYTQKAASEGVAFGVGENLIGEPCRLINAPKETKLPETWSAYDIYCGTWEEPSAHIYRTTATTSEKELATSGIWRDRLDNFVNCQPPTATSILDNLSASALDCTFRVGGWPYQAITARIDDKTFLADTIPSAYPVVERAIGLLTDRLNQDQATDTATISGEVKRLEARLASAQYSTGDLSHYRDLLRLAQYYNFQNNFTEAEKRYRTALDIQKKVMPDDAGNLGFLYMHLALELSNQQRFDVAEVLFDKAESLVPYSYEPTDESRLVSYRAIHLANQGKDEEALVLARKATTMRRGLAHQYGLEFNTTSSAGTEFVATDAANSISLQTSASDGILSSRAATALGDVVQSQFVEAAMLMELGKLEQAEQTLNETQLIMERETGIPRRWLPQIQLLQARLAELDGDLARAEQYLLAGIKSQQSLFNQSRTEGLAYLALARVYAEQGRSREALDVFRTGFAVIERQGGGLAFDDAAPFFQAALAEADRKPAQRQAIFAEMFQVGQTIQGTITAETMALAAARLAASDQDVGSLIRQLQDAHRQRDALLEILTVAESDPGILAPQVAELEQQWQALGNNITQLERQVQAAAPRYNQLIDMPVETQKVLDSLHPDEAISQILVGTDYSIGFFLDAEGIEAYQIDLTGAEAKQTVAKLRHPFEAVDDLPEFPVAEAHALYQQLFGPVAVRLAKAEHVITVPSGPFLSLPFGLLVVKPPPGITDYDYTQVAWMTQRHALTLSPSVQSFINLRNTVQPSKATETFVGFGDFVPYGNVDTLLNNFDLPESCRQDVSLIANASPLPQTANEINAIATTLGVPDTSLFLGEAFTEAEVKQPEIANYRIVYFATHGLLPYELRCFAQPGLLVSKSGIDAMPGDGLLTSGDILDIPLDADLVVLSACNTGGPGEETGGESLSGLARAFFYSGARSLLVTHWETPDEPTTKLMVDTFKRLRSGNLSLAEALRESQTAFIQKYPYWSHPIAWASFTLVGDGDQHLSTGNMTLAAH